MKNKKALLCILDGFAFGDKDDKFNAFSNAKTPNIDEFIKNYPSSSIATSGSSVGLPQGLMGNSEVGHMTIGGGRVFEQNIIRVSNLITNKRLFSSKDYITLENSNQIHLIFLSSTGGIHSNSDHIKGILGLFKSNAISSKVILHLILDGRDVRQDDALLYLEGFLKECFEIYNNIQIGSICGRFYAMDRDNNYERTNRYYKDLFINKNNTNYSSDSFDKQINLINSILKDNYSRNIYDETIEPHLISNYSILINDSFIFCNFRSDRMRQILKCFIGKTASEPINGSIFTMTDYFNDANFNEKNNINILSQNTKNNNTLTDVLQSKGLKQLRIAETEKYAHVTFFFNCAKDQNEIKYCDDILIKSPKVDCFSQKPEMSLGELSDTVINKIEHEKYDFILLNIANCDMVGHSGNFEAAVKAVEFVDLNIGKITKSALQSGYSCLITADHGNVEKMFDENNNSVNKAHTTNDVPLLYLSNENKHNLKNGSLADIAPTVLDILDIEKPNEMTGESLIIKK